MQHQTKSFRRRRKGRSFGFLLRDHLRVVSLVCGRGSCEHGGFLAFLLL
jgi:hypothetical protein